MTERDLYHDGGADDRLDPDRSHALLAQMIFDVPVADEITRARHLRTAVDAFAALTAEPAVTTHSSRRSTRWLTAVAVVAIGLVGFAAVLPLLLTNGQGDADFTAVESDAATLSGVEDQLSSGMRASNSLESAPLSAAAGADRLFNLTGLCDLEIENLTHENLAHENRTHEEITHEEITQGRGGSTWVAYDGIEESRAVILVTSTEEVNSLEEAKAAVADSASIPQVRFVLDPSTCALLRTERAAP
jgi:hypothetical protein